MQKKNKYLSKRGLENFGVPNLGVHTHILVSKNSWLLQHFLSVTSSREVNGIELAFD